MSNQTSRILLGTAASATDLQTQLQLLESQNGMQVMAIGIVGSDSNNLQNFADVIFNINVDQLPQLQVTPVPAAIAADPTKFQAFYQPIIQANTVIDSSMMLLNANQQQQVLLLRPGAPAPSPAPAAGAGTAPKLPDYAQTILSAAQGVPWAKSQDLPAANGYSAVIPDSFRVFRNLQGPGGKSMDVIYYESKLAIDNDGSGPNNPFDPDHQNDTNLHDMQNVALNAHQLAFTVFPLDAVEAAQVHAQHPKVDLKIQTLPDFQKDLGLKIGDLGIAFWREAANGPVRQTYFIYGDKGPANFLGEGSVKMADNLGIDSNPTTGGIGPQKLKQLGKGIIHIAFTGSGQGTVSKSPLVPNGVDHAAQPFYQAFLNQPAAPQAGVAAGPAPGQS